MIKTVADKRTRQLLDGKRVPSFQAFERQALERLTKLADARTIENLMRLPSNRFEALGGNLDGFYSIRINSKWRIIFKFENGDAYDVQIVDYH